MSAKEKYSQWITAQYEQTLRSSRAGLILPKHEHESTLHISTRVAHLRSAWLEASRLSGAASMYQELARNVMYVSDDLEEVAVLRAILSARTTPPSSSVDAESYATGQQEAVRALVDYLDRLKSE